MSPDPEVDLWDELTDLAIKNPRYPREAYLFVLNAIQWSFQQLGSRRHLSGEEFTECLVAYAREEFGELAPLVLSEWGIYSTRDFGEIVYKLIEIDKMSRQQSDSIEDFNDVLDLQRTLKDPNFTPGVLE